MSMKKVLVVDDEIHIVHVVAIKLKNNGYDVRTAENGQVALDLVNEDKPDIIITDYQMPVLTGAEMVSIIRGNEETKDIPVIMLTARNFAFDQEQKDQLKISEFLSKPFSPKALLKIVDDILCPQTVN